MRRPSPALVVALLALFVALGGPAQAKKLLVGSKQIKDRSIAAKDLKKSLVAQLTATADNSITTAKLADGGVTSAKLADKTVTAADLAPDAVPASKLDDKAVGTAKLADGAVTDAKLADDAVTGKIVRNGTLDARDIGGFAGSVPITLGVIAGGCTAGTSTSLTPLIAGQDLGNDAISLTPPASFPDVTVTARPGASNTIRVVACGAGAPTGEVTFRYVTIDVAG